MDPQSQITQPPQTASEQTVQPQKGHPKMLVVIILLLVILSAGLTVIIVRMQPSQDKQPTPTPTQSVTQPTEVPDTNSLVSPQEKQQIDAWIEKNNLNPYGDPPDTVYAGGTPLFNEATGQTKDRYQYIIEQHPDRPWRNEKRQTINIETKDWNTYTDPQNGYTVKYPKDWFFDAPTKQFRAVYPTLGPHAGHDIIITVSTNDKNLSLLQWIQETIIDPTRKEYKKLNMLDEIQTQSINVNDRELILVTGTHLPAAFFSIGAYVSLDGNIVSLRLSPYGNEFQVDKDAQKALYGMAASIQLVE